MTGHPSETLTAFQIEVARFFFSLPTSASFLLAGGAALLAQGLTSRPTQDLDLFTRHPGDVAKARERSSQRPLRGHGASSASGRATTSAGS